ncbi:endoplasmic oxidoreductin [Hysterangium stoloniferum]|nr:endoplasmic oxidoreductin [Hysterangium stoloniferum]
MRLEHLRLHCLPAFLLVYLVTCPYPGKSQASHEPSTRRSFLAETDNSETIVQDVLEYHPVQRAVCGSRPTGPIETTLCDYESVESVTHTLHGHLSELVRAPFFKYFRTDLYRECPFWQENGFCMNRECGITTVDESEIPVSWRAAELSKVEIPTPEQISELPGCYYADSDFCFHDDTSSDGDYIDLTENPERFTGYSGPSAHRVWDSIYEENCFGISERSLHRPLSEKNLLGLDANEAGDGYICEEKRVYYRIISGLHASISMHICRDDFDQNTGKWGPNLRCFVERVAAYPERLKNIYFNTVLLLRAVARLSRYLSAYDYCTTPEGVHEHDGGNIRTKQLLEDAMNIAKDVGRFDENVLFKGENSAVLKDEFKDHFRNVSRIMDCVGCDKCRLWGKVQVSGLGTALKVLFELDEKALDPEINPNLLQRSEVVALINTLNRFTESLVYVDEFRQLWSKESPHAKEELLRSIGLEVPAAHNTQRSKRPSPSGSPQRREGNNRTLPAQIKRILEACRQSTTDCAQLCVKVVGSILAAFGSMFSLASKSEGPKSEL